MFSMWSVNRGTITGMPCGTSFGHSVVVLVFVQNKIFSGNGQEFMKVSRAARPKVKIYCGNHCTSTPHRSETNGIAERAAHRVKGDTSATLLQSGLHGMLMLSTKRSRLLIGRQNLHERRFGEPFCGPIISYGSMAEYHPISATDQTRLHQFGKKVLPGIFRGSPLHAKGGIWTGDVLVADIEELDMLDASEVHA